MNLLLNPRETFKLIMEAENLATKRFKIKHILQTETREWMRQHVIQHGLQTNYELDRVEHKIRRRLNTHLVQGCLVLVTVLVVYAGLTFI